MSDFSVHRNDFLIKELELAIQNNKMPVTAHLFTNVLVGNGIDVSPFTSGVAKTICNNGMLKNFFNALNLVYEYADRQRIPLKELTTTVVVVGAAPAKAYYLLSLMFPKLSFKLIDPNPLIGNNDLGVPFWNPKVLDHFDVDDIILEYFSARLLQRILDEIDYSKTDGVIFINDARRDGLRAISSAQEVTDEILTDYFRNVSQDMNIGNIIGTIALGHMAKKTRGFLLGQKFKLDYRPGTTEYYDGVVVYPCFLKCDSTEGFLITDCLSTRDYSHDEYNDTRFMYNIRCMPPKYNPNGDGFFSFAKVHADEEIDMEYFRGTASSPNLAHVVVQMLFDRYRKANVELPITLDFVAKAKKAKKGGKFLRNGKAEKTGEYYDVNVRYTPLLTKADIILNMIMSKPYGKLVEINFTTDMHW